MTTFRCQNWLTLICPAIRENTLLGFMRGRKAVARNSRRIQERRRSGILDRMFKNSSLVQTREDLQIRAQLYAPTSLLGKHKTIVPTSPTNQLIIFSQSQSAPCLAGYTGLMCGECQTGYYKVAQWSCLGKWQMVKLRALIDWRSHGVCLHSVQSICTCLCPDFFGHHWSVAPSLSTFVGLEAYRSSSFVALLCAR
jgi:hypothetical protein